MVQIMWMLPTTVQTTAATTAATTGGPFEIPEWAPDILWATTTLNNDWPVLVATTSGGTVFAGYLTKNSVSSYLNRTFSLGTGMSVAAIILTYRGVGELTRT